MVTLRRYQVRPVLPEALAPMRALAHNLWWTWNRRVRSLFAHLDADLYEASMQNPLALLAKLPTEVLERAAADPAYLAAIEDARQALGGYLGGDRWFQRTHPDAADLG